jgi:hypothetical protein
MAKPPPTMMNINPDQKSLWLLIFTLVSSVKSTVAADSREPPLARGCGLHVRLRGFDRLRANGPGVASFPRSG